MEIIARLGTLLGLSFISGINLYATVAVVGICIKFQLVAGLPPELHVLANDAVIFMALFLYAVEFLADKVPWIDSLWDSIHTVIRPFGGAMLALMQVGDASPALQVMVFMMGASLACVAHVTKATTRLIINTSPEPFSNITVSVAEDIGAFGLSYLSLAHPDIAFFVTLGCLFIIFFFMPLLIRTARMLFSTLVFRLKCLVNKEAAWTASRSLPFSYDVFLENHKDDGEELVWTGRAYAVGFPGVPKYASLQMVITSKAIRCFYRRWFHIHQRVLPLGSVEHHKCYTGTLFCRWTIRSAEGNWLVYLQQPLSNTLPPTLHPEAKSYE